MAESLGKSIEVAPALGAQIVVLGIASARWNSELFALVSERAIRAAETGIAVHLVLNGQLHLSGDATAVDPARLSLTNLLLSGQADRELVVSGTLPTTFGGGTLAPVVASEVIDAWEFNALARPEFGGESG